MAEDKNKKRILIVEDEKPLARALGLKLENSGFTVVSVYNGNDAVEILKKEKFDVMILDLIMPLMDGFAVLKELKDLKIKLPIIAASNLAQKEDVERAKTLGANYYFVKSNTSLAQIIDYIKKILAWSTMKKSKRFFCGKTT